MWDLPGWLEVLGAVSAIGAGIYRWCQPPRGIRPAYFVYWHRVISASPHRGIEVRFHDQVVDTLYRSVLVFVNKGSDTVTSRDIVPKAPLKLVFPDGKVLDARVLGATTEVVGAEAGVEGQAVAFTFDHLNTDDGFAIEVFHTRSPIDVTLDGAFQRGKPVVLKSAMRVVQGWLRGWAILGAIGVALILVAYLAPEFEVLTVLAASYALVFVLITFLVPFTKRYVSRAGIPSQLWDMAELPLDGHPQVDQPRRRS